MLYLFTFLFILGSMPMAISQEVKLFHYNIKELDSEKIQTQAGLNQLQAVQEILQKFDFDILSLNEIQFDLNNIPNKQFKTHGKNLDFLKTKFKLNTLKYKSFNIANTGLKAKTKEDGSFYINPNSIEARASADKVNFGTMPGQYSTGALFKFKKINEVIINRLKWKDFNPKLNLDVYADDTGNALPDDIELFDKNFTDITLDIYGKELHLILLHTVPAYHFGNPKSINSLRNGDQLKFLEWYLTGSTDINVQLKDIKPLEKNNYFLAVGDWNTEYNNTVNPGSLVLRRLFSKVGMWMQDPTKLTYTNESSGYRTNPTRLMLDYIAHSKNIEVMDARIIHPQNSQIVDFGCDATISAELPADFEVIEYLNNGQKCKVAVHKEYKKFKEASDHYPIWGHFKLK